MNLEVYIWESEKGMGNYSDLFLELWKHTQKTYRKQRNKKEKNRKKGSQVSEKFSVKSETSTTLLFFLPLNSILFIYMRYDDFCVVCFFFVSEKTEISFSSLSFFLNFIFSFAFLSFSLHNSQWENYQKITYSKKKMREEASRQ